MNVIQDIAAYKKQSTIIINIKLMKTKYLISKALFIILLLIMFWRFGELLYNWNYENGFWLSVSFIAFICNWVNFVIVADRYEHWK